MKIKYLVNARRETLLRDVCTKLRADGFLVPPAYLTRELTRRLAEDRHFWSGPTLVDNGLFDDINRIFKSRRPPRDTVAEKRANPKLQLSRRKRTELPADVRRWVDRTVAFVERKASSVKPFQLMEALRLKPTAVVGAERIHPALWFRFRLEPSWLDNGYSRLRALNRDIVRDTNAEARRNARGKVTDLPVASACDYDSARDAGRILAKSGVNAVALPFGAYMADDRFTETVRIRGRLRKLGDNVPARPVRCAAVARGFVDGWCEASRRLPVHVHLLGLGQPLILGVAALAFRGVNLLTCDATSPFKDAVAGDIYTEMPVFLKLDASAIVKHQLTAGLDGWNCPCAFCKSVALQQQWVKARAWLDQIDHKQRRSELTMGRESHLRAMLPYFALNAGTQLETVRALHNNWVVTRCVARLNKAATNQKSLAAFVANIVKRYRKAARSEVYGKALEAAADIASGH